MSLSSFQSNALGGSRRKNERKSRNLRSNARVAIERLEERLVLSTFDVTGGSLRYTALAGVNNNVTLSTTGATITLNDSVDTINLTANAIAAGFSVDAPHHTVTGPETSVASMLLDTADGADTFHIQSAIKFLTISPTTPGAGTQTISLGNATHGVQDITNLVSIANTSGRTTLTLDDSTNATSSRNVTISGTSVVNLTPSFVTLAPGSVSTLNILGGSNGNSFNFQATLASTVNVSTGTGVDSTTVQQLSAGSTLNIQGQSSTDGVTIGDTSSSNAAVLGHVDIKNTSSRTSLFVNDAGDAAARTISAGASQISGLNASGLITFVTNDLTSVRIDGGSGGNTFTISDTVFNQTTTINSGSGNDVVLLQAAGLGSTVNINGQGGNDQVTLGNSGVTAGILANSVNVGNVGGHTTLTEDDSADATGRTATVTATQVVGLTPNGPLNFPTGSQLTSLSVKGGNGGNTFTISNGGGNVFPTYFTSGSGNDTFIFTNGATLAGGTIDGGPGSDTLDYHLYTTPVTVNLNTMPQTATGTVSVSNIENVIGGSGGNVFTAPAGVPSNLQGTAGDDTFIIPANAGDVTVDGNGGIDDLQIFGAGATDTFTTSLVAGRLTTVVTGSSPTHTVSASGINTVELNGGTGDTTATVDFAGGNPIPVGGLTYAGGGGTNNVLKLINNLPTGPFTNETYDAFGPGAGDINLDGSIINFSGLSPIFDSTSAVNFTFNAPAAVNNIAVTSVPTVNLVANGTRIASTDTPIPGFESIDLADKTNVTINSVTTTDTTVTVNDPTGGAGLARLTINTGNGNDFINLLNTPTGVALFANSGSGTDTFNVNASGLGGTASINASTATGTLIYDASNLTTAETATTLTSGARPTLTFANITTLTVNHILDLPLINTPATLAPIQEGDSFTGVVGSFSVSNPTPIPGQVNPIAVASDFVASISFGDGTAPVAGTIVANNTGGFDVIGTHVFAATSNPAIIVTVTHKASSSSSTLNGVTTTLQTNGGSTTTITTAAVVNDAPLTSTGVPVIGVEGAAIAAGTLVASFSDADPAAAAAGFVASISWGDGTTSAGTVTSAGGLVSNFLVRSATPHTYARYGNYSVQVTITDTAPIGGTASSTIAASNATITDAALTATGTNVAATEGTVFTGQVATFTDANPVAPISDFTVTINWGNGVSTPGTVTQPGGVGTPFVVTGTQTYLKVGTFPIAVTINDIGGATATATSTATVAGAVVTPGPATPITGTESVAFSTYVGTFTSANPLSTAADFTATVSWGDGTPISLGSILQAANGSFFVTAGHTYAEETAAGTPNTFTVTVRSSAGIVATLTGTATIVDAPLSASSAPVTSVEGTSSVLKVATFVDTDPNGTVADYTVVINWGDGSTSTGAAATITQTGTSFQGAAFTISAAHTYAEEGNYLITSTVTDVGGASASTTTPVSVANAELVGTGVPVVATEGVPLVNVPVATFIDLGGPEKVTEYAATVDWGDGTSPSMGAITLGANGTTFTVTGSHIYQESGTFPITVTVTQSGAEPTVILTTATVASAPVILSGNLDSASDSGISNSDKITNVTQPVFTGFSEPGTIIKLYAAKNGVNPVLVGTGVAGVDGAWTIRSSHLADGAYIISITSTDPDSPNEVTGPTILLGGNDPSRPALIIDTVGPVVTEAIFRRPLGKIIIAFQDLGGGITTANIQDGINYSFTTYGKTKYPPSLVTGFTTVGQGGNRDPIEMDIEINNKRPLRTGRYVLTVKSGGITDIAGNALDGEYYGFLPSGNGKPGGDFKALLVSNRSYTFAAFPTQTSATPKTPPGIKPIGYPTPGKHHESSSNTAGNSAANTHATKAPVSNNAAVIRAINHALHDAALAGVSVPKKSKGK